MALAKPSASKKKASAKGGLRGLIAGLKKKPSGKAETRRADAKKVEARKVETAKGSKKAESAPALPKKAPIPAKAAESAMASKGKTPAQKGKTAPPPVKAKPGAVPSTKKGGTKKAGGPKALPHATQIAESGEAVCREVACEGLATTGGYCRMHYIKNWKKIKRKELILKEKKLNQYIEELVAKYPDKYIEAIRQDLASDKDFAKVISDLDLDESIDDFEMDSDSVDSFIDNIRRDFDDEGEGF